MKKFFHSYCGWNADIETWDTLIGKRYVCKHCGAGGLMSDEDAPKFLNENEQKDNESDYDFVKRIYHDNT